MAIYLLGCLNGFPNIGIVNRGKNTCSRVSLTRNASETFMLFVDEVIVIKAPCMLSSINDKIVTFILLYSLASKFRCVLHEIFLYFCK